MSLPLFLQAQIPDPNSRYSPQQLIGFGLECGYLSVVTGSLCQLVTSLGRSSHDLDLWRQALWCVFSCLPLFSGVSALSLLS